VRDLAFLVLHLLTTIVRLAGPGGARAVVPNPCFSNTVFTEVNALPLDEGIGRHHVPIGWAARLPI
jgi:hypothetical protein